MAFVHDIAPYSPLAGMFDNPYKSPQYRRVEQLGDLSKNYAFDYAIPKGKELLDQSMSGFGPVMDYYKQLLSGNRSEMMGAVAPEVEQIRSQYDQAKKNISAFTPRGGGQTSILSELPFRQGADVQRLLQTVRPGAARGLGETAGQVGGLAGQVTGQGLQSAGLAQRSFEDMLNMMMGKDAQSQQNASNMGEGLGKMMMMMLMGA